MYCGSALILTEDATEGSVTEHDTCIICTESIKGRPVLEWLRWVKKHNAYRWELIASYHAGKTHAIAQDVQQVLEEQEV